MIPLLLAACSAPDPRPDVIVITVDTLRADRLGFAGLVGAHTPAIDTLAAAGRVFSQATTPLPRTTPALGSLQTGLRPHHHGAREVGQVLTAEHTLAGWLADAGYTTAGVSAISVAGPEQKMDRGFGSFVLQHDAPAPDIARSALAAVDDASTSRPLYLWTHFADPHFPYLPHAGAPVQPDAPRCRDLGQRAGARTFKREVLFTDRGGLASQVLDECRELYDAEIAAVDQAIGALLDGLDTKRPGRPRWVVFTADHGENQGEGGLFFEHGPNVEDAALRIPMIVAGPGVVIGTDDGVARLEDLAPTLLDALSLPVPTDLDGISLLGRLQGRGGGPDLALAESGSALQVPLFGYLVSGRSKRWCLNDTQWSWCWLGERGFGLYDHDADPDLKTDRQHELPDVVQRLTAAATRWKPEHARQRTARTATHKLVSTPTLDGGRTVTLVFGSDPGVEADLRQKLEAFEAELDGRTTPVTDASSDTVEALRSLGYVE